MLNKKDYAILVDEMEVQTDEEEKNFLILEFAKGDIMQELRADLEEVGSDDAKSVLALIDACPHYDTFNFYWDTLIEEVINPDRKDLIILIESKISQLENLH